ncbi:hypothetical protein VF04_34980 [Nostoc linckia z7]|uniref:Uncharacterized protein n=1 Tax=Nostoc linckia z7 TaxID=1628745 RepID=A0ABX4KI67_NOSLI|nr:hypothetical protein [Nostoc linckia]PHJ51476.1 hypothetical protein VF02_37880 [Nostoc linckia z1]PHJ59267.1 hypothetical protein VF05_32255 [Nostoc linckia z3]PHJ63662.1 hypothetical protein VF03_30130 [Nostoc linckia z2]PHJ73876.1 hypothetical protein VF06_35760 [Nostoc linckia z4]PHJ87183.1 hypothetical protein VF04_34980 [Nostoc linckia z7]
MTKVIILGEQPKEEKKLKPIELIKWISSIKGICEGAVVKPSEYDFVVLLSRLYDGSAYDLMYVYDKNQQMSGTLYLGHFNDGVVE